MGGRCFNDDPGIHSYFWLTPGETLLALPSGREQGKKKEGKKIVARKSKAVSMTPYLERDCTTETTERSKDTNMQAYPSTFLGSS